MSDQPRDTWEVKPPRPVRYKGEGMMFVSFDAPRLEVTRGIDGKRAITWDSDECYVTFWEAMSGKTIRVHLQDDDLEF